ncbi:hypothetical protein [Mesorhizobium sp.]|uniref:hypothetical protein n=1 Tax=Mesorhizobium sp. TaxID=1871066 RepID=UPI001211D55F|nr:hypothetical protein [Mesorhizobium sp.]TIO29342.1 MAG: hypothetical protein E5X89_31265 [Mesorhizobium sp.]
MADFVGPLKRTLGGLSNPTPEVRARVYDKARVTIADQLAKKTPPLAPSVIAQHERTLEDAIATVEREYARPAPGSDPLAELEDILFSVDRNRNLPSQTTTSPEPAVNAANTGESIEAALADALEVAPISSQSQADSAAAFRFGRPSQGSPRRTRRKRPARERPPEPAITEGPRFELRGGKLAGTTVPLGNFSEKAQAALHRNLRAVLAESEAQFAKMENKFPELVKAAREYTALIAPETNNLDVVSIYAVGASLLSFADAYREQNIALTLAEPIEPQTAAALQAITRIHGAFIMGFEEGAELVRKSDEFLLDVTRIREIEVPGNALLESFVTNSRIIEQETLRANEPVRDYVVQFGWSGSRAGYSAYVSVRNIVISSTKILFGELSILGVLGGAVTVSALAGDPNMEFIRNVVPILRANAADLLTFFNHSPELRSYIEWVIQTLEQDHKLDE